MLLLLTLAVIVAGARLPFITPGDPLLELLAIHVGLLIGFGLAVVVMARWENASWVRFLRPLTTVGVIFTCYTTLGKLGVTAMPFVVDGWLSRLDTLLVGLNPSLLLEPYLTPGRVEFFSFFYGAFIPYIYVTIALNCLGQPPVLRDQFLTGWVALYFLSYLGYIFLPARGPLVFHEYDYAGPISGGFFYKALRVL